MQKWRWRKWLIFEICTAILAQNVLHFLLSQNSGPETVGRGSHVPTFLYLFVTMLLLPLSQSPGADALRSLFLLVSSGTSKLTIRFAKWMAWLKTVLSSCCTNSCWVDLFRVGQRRSCSAARSMAVFSWYWSSESLSWKKETQDKGENPSLK